MRWTAAQGDEQIVPVGRSEDSAQMSERSLGRSRCPSQRLWQLLTIRETRSEHLDSSRTAPYASASVRRVRPSAWPAVPSAERARFG